MPVEGTPKEIIAEEMHRYKHGQLHSGPDKYGHIVKNPKQAVAIAMNMARRHGRAYGGQAPFTGEHRRHDASSADPGLGRRR